MTMNGVSTSVVLSVVVCFKDWGLDRLIGVTKSIKASGLGPLQQIIIADYGSTKSEGYRETLEALGAEYYYFATDGTWSRSRALNLGISKAKGQYIVTTDADMLFLPSTYPAVIDLLREDPNAYYILQCRDLPEGICHQDVLDGSVAWERLETISRLRPRWGMGGLIAFPSWAYRETRGLDERLAVYGGEDIDFAKRLARVGLKRSWIDDPAARMYHVWHPSSLEEAEKTAVGSLAVRANREVHLSDKSTLRNLETWRGRPEDADPLVTVAISTYNRCEYLEESLKSVFAQTFKDFEVIVVDDGSTDQTMRVLESIEDPRLRVIQQKNRGLAYSRNRITEVARGKYIAVHDDDDIMLPWRLEQQLKVVGNGVSGAYGGWVDFDNRTGALSYNRGKKFSLSAIGFNSGIYLHPTLLVERDLMRAVPYDETMRSGSDYNLAVRMARVGARLKHCGDAVLLRRLHSHQITNTHSKTQKVSGRVSGNFARSTFGPSDIEEARKERGKKDWVAVPGEEIIEPRVRPYLPSHLVKRNAEVAVDSAFVGERQELLDSVGMEFAGRIIKGSHSRDLFHGAGLSLDAILSLHSAFGSAVRVVSEDCTGVNEHDVSSGQSETEFEAFVEKALEELPAGKYLISETSSSVDSFSEENLSESLLMRIEVGEKAYLVQSKEQVTGCEQDLRTVNNMWELERVVTQ